MRALWPLIGVVAIVSATWGVWSVVDAGAPAPADTVEVPVSPADARQHEILKANIGRASDPVLAGIFQAINVKHFGAAMPAVPIMWEPRLGEVGALAGQSFTLEGMFGRIGTRAAILLNPSLQADPPALQRALCHEIVHAYLSTIGEAGSGHGPEFQAVLRRLSQEGAFEGVLADDNDRAELRAWLDAESARLDVERAEMDRMGVEIEAERIAVERAIADLAAGVSPAGQASADDAAAVQSRRDDYNRRAISANARLERGRADLARFNAEVERYNLMLVYPDGIDVQARMPAKPVVR